MLEYHPSWPEALMGHLRSCTSRGEPRPQSVFRPPEDCSKFAQALTGERPMNSPIWELVNGQVDPDKFTHLGGPPLHFSDLPHLQELRRIPIKPFPLDAEGKEGAYSLMVFLALCEADFCPVAELIEYGRFLPAHFRHWAFAVQMASVPEAHSHAIKSKLCFR